MKKILFIALSFVLLFGCVSQEPVVEEKQDVNNTSGSEHAFREFSINETVVSSNVSLKVTSWGFAPIVQRTHPPEGAKYLWVYVIAKNVGNVPTTLTDDFTINYRGVNTSLKGGIIDGYFNVFADTKKYFPDTGEEGFVYCEVPLGIADDEASFIADIKGEKFQLELSSPVEYDPPLTITSERIDCETAAKYYDYSHYCRLLVSLKNNHPIPFSSSSTLTSSLTRKYTINKGIVGERVQEIVLYKPGYQPVMWVKLGPYEEKGDYLILDLKLNRDDSIFRKDSDEFGRPGDNVIIDIELYDLEGYLVAEKELNMQLPVVD